MARRLRGSVRHIAAVDGDRREHDEQRRAALDVPEEEARELDAIGDEVWGDGAPAAAAGAPAAAAGGGRAAQWAVSPPASAPWLQGNSESGSGDEWSPPASAPWLPANLERSESSGPHRVVGG